MGQMLIGHHFGYLGHLCWSTLNHLFPWLCYLSGFGEQMDPVALGQG